MEGVYKYKTKIALPDGPGVGEDILEFVPISDVAAYLRIHLDFDYGHLCSLYGIVEYRGDEKFSFQDPDKSENDILCAACSVITGVVQQEEKRRGVVGSVEFGVVILEGQEEYKDQHLTDPWGGRRM